MPATRLHIRSGHGERAAPVLHQPPRSVRALACAAVFACSLTFATVHAGGQTLPVPDLVSLEEISLQEFEPAVRDQIGRAYEQARKGAQDGAAAGNLGMVLQAYGKYELAASCYRRARALDRRSFRWPYYLGAVEGMLGNNPEATAHVREALALNPAYAPARVRLARLLFDAGEAGQSATLYRAIVDQNPRLASAHFGLGQLLAAQGDWHGAIESFRRACEIAENYAAAEYALAMAYRSAGDLEQTRVHLERYQRLKQARQPSDDPLMDKVKSLYAGGMTHFASGSSLAQEGKPREAAAEFEAALKVNPRLVMAHINLIAMYGRLDLPEKAEQHFRAAVELDAGWVEAYYNWGMFLVEHGRKAEAAQVFLKAVEVNKNYPDAQFQLGSLLDESGHSQEAAARYERALELDPHHRQARYFLARNLVRAGRVEDGIRHLLEMLKVEDRWTPLCMRALAIAYEYEGKREQALYYIGQARQRAASLNMRDLAADLQRDSDRLNAEGTRP